MPTIVFFKDILLKVLLALQPMELQSSGGTYHTKCQATLYTYTTFVFTLKEMKVHQFPQGSSIHVVP
jgi:hypothetical protein